MQTISQHLELDEINLEIKRSCRRIRKEKREQDEVMANQGAQPRALEEYSVPSLTGSQNCMVKPNIEANTFEIKPAPTSRWFHNTSSQDCLQRTPMPTWLHSWISVTPLGRMECQRRRNQTQTVPFFLKR